MLLYTCMPHCFRAFLSLLHLSTRQDFLLLCVSPLPVVPHIYLQVYFGTPQVFYVMHYASRFSLPKIATPSSYSLGALWTRQKACLRSCKLVSMPSPPRYLNQVCKSLASLTCQWHYQLWAYKSQKIDQRATLLSECSYTITTEPACHTTYKSASTLCYRYTSLQFCMIEFLFSSTGELCSHL